MLRCYSFLKYLKLRNIQDRITYLRWFNFIEQSQWWSKDELYNYQWEKIKFLLFYVNENIPYYTKLFNQIGCHPNDIKNWDDFRKIPILTKEDVRSRINDFIPLNCKNINQLIEHKTGGSTGEPFVFYKEHRSYIIDQAFRNHHWKRVGYQEGDSIIIFRGDVLQNNELFKQYRFYNVWRFSSYHLSPKYLNSYVDMLNRIKPNFLYVYPSSLYTFTKLLINSDYTLNFSPIAILCDSEPLFDFQRTLFEKFYSSRVYSWLGLAEQTTLAYECEYSTSLHVSPQHSYVELLDDIGLPINEKGMVGSIIGTSLYRLTTPLIRYNAGDLATFEGTQCSLCGRQYHLLGKIEGRSQNLLILNDGRQIPLFHIPTTFNFEAFKRIKKLQMVQNIKGQLIIKISTTEVFNDNDESEIKSKMNAAVNNQLRISFVYTDDFIQSVSGKHIYFIQNIHV